MSILIAAILLGGMFGTASATVESTEGGLMVVDIEVEVEGSTENVVAHLSFDRDPPLALPLLDRGNAVFGLRTELEQKNYVVVFEVVGESPQTSGPVTLAQMGADLVADSESEDEDDEDEGLSPESRRLLWLAVALGAASLSVLAFWVLGGRDRLVNASDDVVVVEEGESVVVEPADDVLDEPDQREE